MKGFYKMRLFAWILPLALGLSACGGGSSSSSSSNPGITPPDSSLTTVSYGFFSDPSGVTFSCIGSDSQGGVGIFDQNDYYNHAWCDGWINSDVSIDNISDFVGNLSGASGQQFDISEYVGDNSEAIVSAKLIMYMSASCPGQICDSGSVYEDAVNAGIPLGISFVANLGEVNEDEKFVHFITILATDDSAVAGTKVEIEIEDSEVLGFLQDHPVFSLRFVGKSFAIYSGDRGDSIDSITGEAYPNVSPKLELILKNYTPPDE